MSKRKETITDTKKPFDENLNKDLLFNTKIGRKANIEAEQYFLIYLIKELENKAQSLVNAEKLLR